MCARHAAHPPGASTALAPYQPGKPVEEVQRELGLERVVKLASNEGPFPPFPAALEAIERVAPRAQPLPRRRRRTGCRRRSRPATASRSSRSAPARAPTAASTSSARRCSTPATRSSAAGPRSRATPIYAAKQGAAAVKVPLREGRYDLEALAAAVGPRTKLVYVCHPNNPTGTMQQRPPSSTRCSSGCPRDVLAVVDQAYFEYIDDPDYPDAVERYVKHGRRVLVLRTFSKIYGLAGLRVGYAVGPRERLRRDGEAAPALRPHEQRPGGGAREPRRRRPSSPRRRELNRAGRARARARSCARTGSSRPRARSRNFLYVETGAPAERALRAAAARGRDRAPAARLRRPERDPHQRRHARGARAPRRRARPRSAAAPARRAAAAARGRARRCRRVSAPWLERASAVVCACSETRRFRLLFLATLGSGLGNWLALIALQVDVYDRTHSGWWVGALLVANILPAVFIGLLLGPLVDRLSRKGLMIGSDLGRLAVFAALPFVGSAAEIVLLAVGRRDRQRLLPPGGARRPAEPRRRRRARRARTRCCSSSTGRRPRSGRCSAA